MKKQLRCKIWPVCNKQPAKRLAKILKRNGLRRVSYSRQADAILIVSDLSDTDSAAIWQMHKANEGCRFVVFSDNPILVPKQIRPLSIRSIWANENDFKSRFLAAMA